MNKMRIALFTDTYPPEINGVATSCKSLRDTLVSHGHDVLVVTTNPFSDKLIVENGFVRIPGPELKKMYGYRLANIASRKALKAIRKFNPDIAHVQTEFTIGIFARIVINALDCPSIYTYHTMYEDYTYYVTKGFFDRLGKHFVRSFSKNMINHYDGFITPSSKTKDYMRRIGVDIYANVIPTGVDFSRFSDKNVDFKKVKELKEKFFLDDDTFVLLSLGRIAKEKSIDFSIKCFAKFLEIHNDVKTKMVIVGKGPAVDDLINLTEQLNIKDKVIFVGPCLPSEVQNYYKLGNVFVSASLSETQGLTYMEAMAAHLYVLARYDHNLLDVIQEGKTGFFFENETEFADKMYKAYLLYKNKDDSMLNLAINSLDNYSIETFYQRIIKAYKHVIKQRW
ncbi:MAG TPA: hypothetical protein DDW20_03620 [Firmicutes bacterium]|nr:hypothetical protein [Bacillota bacterium]